MSAHYHFDRHTMHVDSDSIQLGRGVSTKAWKCNFGDDFKDDFGGDLGGDLRYHL